jgi:hypothetical protein
LLPHLLQSCSFNSLLPFSLGRSSIIALIICAWLLVASTGQAQTQLDSLGIQGWRTTTSSVQLSSDSLLSIPFASLIALDYERILTLNRWGYNASYDWHGRRSFATERTTFFQISSQGSSILREDTRSRTAETFNRVSAVMPTAIDWLDAKALISGMTYHSGAPQNAFFINDPNTQIDGYGIAGPVVRFAENGHVEVGGGIARQSNIAGGSFGSALRFAGSMMEEEVGEQQFFNAEALFDQRQFGLREQLYRTGRGRASLRSEFEGDVVNEASVGYELLLRDFFFSQTSDSNRLTKQRRNETSLTITDRLIYPRIADGTDMMLEVVYAPRHVTRRSDAGNTLPSSLSSISTILLPNELNAYRLSLDAGLLYSDQWLSGLPLNLSIRARYEEQDERAELLTEELQGGNATITRRASDILNEVSFNSGATQLIAAAAFGLHEDHSVQFQATGRIHRHSTISSDNMDDRDDQLFTARATHEWRWHRNVTGVTELRLSQSHIVYLNAARSAQNSVTKAISLSHTSSYLTRDFFHRLGAEVFANYTVLDYYDRLPQLQSIGNYLLRGLSIRDSLLTRIASIQIIAPLELSFQSQIELRLNERGSYDEASFKERRSLLITEAGGEAAFGFHYRGAEAPLSVHLGARAFLYTRSGSISGQQRDWHEQERQLRVGPLLSLVMTGDSGPELFGALWHAFVSTKNATLSTPTQQTEAHLGVRFRL